MTTTAMTIDTVAARDSSTATHARHVARVAVLGASGYVGQEFARLSLMHPGLELVVLSSREWAGRPAAGVIPGFDPRAAALPPIVAPAALPEWLERDEFDTLVSCLPNGGLRAVLDAHPSLAATARIIDLSSDYRDGSNGYVYGLPEAFRTSVVNATRIANPGCYPTAAALALLPALAAGRIDGPVTITAVSGVTGAGRSPALRTSFAELDGGAAMYSAGTDHGHVAEMERSFSAASGHPTQVGFVAQLAPMSRGILLTAFANLDRAVSRDEMADVYAQRYAAEPFVRLLAHGEYPETRYVKSSNRCDVAVTTLHGGRQLMASAAIDNLVKGAAGQAIQNLNLILDWPEDWGLPVHGSPW
jgi:N-acetyl-gamma-glutamyl-phosphate reductase